MMTDSEIAAAISDLRTLTAEDKLEWSENGDDNAIETTGLPGYRVVLTANRGSLTFEIEGPTGVVAQLSPSDGRAIEARSVLAGQAFALFTQAREQATTMESAAWADTVKKVQASD